MAKNKITAETLVDKCSNENCKYNIKHFCELHSIMLNEQGKCVYVYKVVDAVKNI